MTTSTQEIDLSTITPEHLQIVQSVYKLMAFLLDEDANYDTLTTEELELIHLATSNIKIRDGVFKYFSDAPFNIRVDIMKSFTTISQAMVDDELMEAEAIGYSSMVLAAMMLCHAGMKTEANEDRDDDVIEYELKLVDDLLHEAVTLGCTASLLGLLRMARDHNIPPEIFYSSIEAVSFHKVTDPTGHEDE